MVRMASSVTTPHPAITRKNQCTGATEKLKIAVPSPNPLPKPDVLVPTTPIAVSSAPAPANVATSQNASSEVLGRLAERRARTATATASATTESGISTKKTPSEPLVNSQKKFDPDS